MNVQVTLSLVRLSPPRLGEHPVELGLLPAAAHVVVRVPQHARQRRADRRRHRRRQRREAVLPVRLVAPPVAVPAVVVAAVPPAPTVTVAAAEAEVIADVGCEREKSRLFQFHR